MASFMVRFIIAFVFLVFVCAFIIFAGQIAFWLKSIGFYWTGFFILMSPVFMIGAALIAWIWDS